MPLRGLRMEIQRLDLATASIIRADSVDVPAEARSSESSGGAGWEPTFLAVTRVSRDPAREPGDDADRGPDAGTRAVEAFRSLITAPAPVQGRRRRPRPARLDSHRRRPLAPDLDRLGPPAPGRLPPGRLRASRARRLLPRARRADDAPGRAGPQLRQQPPRPLGLALRGRASSAARPLDALNDYLLSLRFLLEGGGPPSLGLSMRVASLCADPDDRGDVKSTIDKALGLERELWSGEPPVGLGDHTPAEIAADVEDLTRAILKDAACGHLGSDLRATADEILLADGLAVGDGADDRGETAEWGSTVADRASRPADELDPSRSASPSPRPGPSRMPAVERRLRGAGRAADAVRHGGAAGAPRHPRRRRSRSRRAPLRPRGAGRPAAGGPLVRRPRRRHRRRCR